jgi:hypothetical protein
MKKHYKTFNELMTTLDGIVRKTTKHYLTDWTDYDIPRLNENIVSNDLSDKRLTLIVRDCGTWLIYTDDISKPGTGANTLFNYYKPGGVGSSRRNPEKFYNLDLSALTIVQIKFDENGRIIQTKKARRAA